MAFYKIRMQKDVIAVMLIFPSVWISVKLTEMNHSLFKGKKSVIPYGCQI